jgi:uncharacterized protein DUF6160
MKKLAIFLAIMLIPFSAFALDTISDNDLNDVTGQAGVSIYTNSIQIVKTGVTTTYTDNDNEYSLANDFNVVTEAETTQIFFKGADPLMIDVINMQTLQDYLSTVGIASNDLDFGDTAVMIVLPNGIEINKTQSVKSYYSGSVGPDPYALGSNQMITVTTSNAKTLICHADANWSPSSGTHYTLNPIDNAGQEMTTLWSNTKANGTDDGGHTDQIGILITAHDD